jgi:four helix bundle protein
MIKSYRDLVVWQKAVALVTEVYRITKEFPKDEVFGLISQMRRSAISISSNIAEGHGRASRKEYVYFLSNARGSLLELETQVTIAQNLTYINEPITTRLLTLTAEIGRIINGLMSALKHGKADKQP